ncbi:MAG: hypothetical protein JWL82_618 [Parcubacteria group bacterium]|nr:hypothetical protein [Parcubacteria group bacterium]
MLLALVFGTVFLTVLAALSSFVLTENKLQTSQTEKSKALTIAEAGIEYYRWFLAHYPNDMQNGTGVPGPYSITYNDPEGTQAGTISLAVTGNSACGMLTSVDLRSTGTPAGSNSSATIYARYARPTVGQYSYIINDSVWAGADRVINGPYHSNGGVRMDGTANSPVTSSLATWSCTSSYGCSPTATKNGVFGTGPNQTLWSYPSPQVDFSAISANFTSLKTTATATGLFFATNGTTNASRGYHLIFNGNGTVTVKKVNSTTNIQSLPIDNTSSTDTTDYTVISSETLLGTYTIPATCGLIYVEDDVWVEGTINTKVTLVAADVLHAGVTPNANLRNNLKYSAYDGTTGLTLIAENNILITADSPNAMTLNGIFIAQGGAFGRNLYDCPSSYEPRGTLTILGTTVSNKRTGTKWINGCNSGDAGYQTRIDSYDRRIATDPPPFTPYTSTDYRFIDWRQK